MKTIKGDLLALAREGRFDVIAHGCNCMCAMGAGIAKGIKALFPEAYQADCRTKRGDRNKLGTCTSAVCKTDAGQVVVVNAYTQHHWRGSGVLVDYDAVRSCMKWIKSQFPGRRLGLPKIGAGLAKGDWNLISSIIEQELAGEDVTIVEFQPEGR